MDFRTASGWGARREAGRLARDHDVVVVDMPPKSDLEARPAIEAADLVAVPIQPTPVDLWASAATLTIAARERTPALLILNRVPARASLTAEMVDDIRALGAALAEARLGNRVAFAASMGEGGTVLETAPGSKGAVEADTLAREIIKRCRADGLWRRRPSARSSRSLRVVECSETALEVRSKDSPPATLLLFPKEAGAG
jgi:chromosome partitioning protein